MEPNLLEGYSLEQLHDYSIRDQLLNHLYIVHQRNGATSEIAGHFRLHFDLLIGLIMSEGMESEAVHTQFKAIRQEFLFYHHFDDILAELEKMLKPSISDP